MKPTGNPNINNKTYWNMIYSDKQKRDVYAAQGTSINISAGYFIKPTMRFYRAVEEVKEGDKVLDIGCGVGVFTDLVFRERPNCEIWGTDISDRACHDNTVYNPKIKYLCQKVGEQTELPDNYFNFVFSGEVLEHLDEPKNLFLDAYRVLAPRGRFLLTTPCGDAIKSEEHVWEFNHDDIEDLYHANGFDRVKFIYLPDLEHMLVIMAVGIKV
jgi:2-polyprenyl-3-methyl-5-hydroxy-6-metoxy-1,4-benzoquinol methylase